MCKMEADLNGAGEVEEVSVEEEAASAPHSTYLQHNNNFFIGFREHTRELPLQKLAQKRLRLLQW